MFILDVIKESLRNEANALGRLAGEVGEEYVSAVQIILNCKGKVVISGIGKSGHVGKKIAASLSSTGTPSFFVHAAEAVHGDSGMIEKRDVVILISNSGETAEVLSMLDVVKRIGSQCIAITKNSGSTLAAGSEVALTYSYEKEADHLDLAPTTSAMLQLAIGDALAVTISRLKAFGKDEFYLYHPGGSLGKKLSDHKNESKSG
ncbi:KpsF/GutQ family sugar-phosphate isomerase [Paenibacillus contaminans]|uniref:KpsF/GutQ family sugar-phosphate isomerase n=1 Tax=Paenibacillus contaminans TaxID=450362 RepID=A0A329MDL1_9BACL|nr:SIS domain-containing protein [Paenibacillus contaminans]RAV17682.1 KpsF/GutQ family sugar-phosphate isomerase [Paenibacillus contaminans]